MDKYWDIGTKGCSFHLFESKKLHSDLTALRIKSLRDPSIFLLLIYSYLADRYQRVSIGDYLSELLANGLGIPQGFVLGPLLFSLYINDIPSRLRSAMHHMFADDVQLYSSFPANEIDESVRKLNEDLLAVGKWANENSLVLNASKSQAIVFSEWCGCCCSSGRIE